MFFTLVASSTLIFIFRVEEERNVAVGYTVVVLLSVNAISFSATWMYVIIIIIMHALSWVSYNVMDFLIMRTPCMSNPYLVNLLFLMSSMQANRFYTHF